MLDSIELSKEYVSVYRRTVDGMDAVMREHHVAMAALDLQDAVELGIIVMRRWMRAVEEWHAHVSESTDRYNERTHRSITENEQSLIAVCRHLISLTESIRIAGYQLEHLDEFRELLRSLIALSEPIPAEYQRNVLRPLCEEALREQRAGLLEECENPFSLD